MPERRQPMPAKPGQWHYAEIEAAIALVSSPFDQPDKQKFHCIA
jgi:hypothetical protein